MTAPATTAVESTDVEMKNVDSPVTEPEVSVDVSSIQEIRENIRQIEKAVQSKEPRFILRVLRLILRFKLASSF